MKFTIIETAWSRVGS